jgi:tRNA(fMet)-specific endonuclease VapC
MFLLDTDHLVVIQWQSEPEWSILCERLNRHRRKDFFVSIVSFHEQALGANTYSNVPNCVEDWTR